MINIVIIIIVIFASNLCTQTLIMVSIYIHLPTPGAVYRALASDGDLGLTCPLGPGEAARCPCAAMAFRIVTGDSSR